MDDKTYLTGLFADRDSAERAYRAALDRGYTQDELDVVMSDETRACQFAPDHNGRTTGLGSRAAANGRIGLSTRYERIKEYERGVAQGGIVIGVRPRNEDDANFLERLWRDADAFDVHR